MTHSPGRLKIVMASPEIAPFAKTGGLGDVLGALPQALEQLGVAFTLVMPAYQTVLRGDWPLEDTGVVFSVPVSSRWEKGTLLKTKTGNDITVYFIRADHYFDRPYLYGTPQGDYPDNSERFIFFSRAVLEVLKLDPPAVLHAHDWQTALAIAFLKMQPELYRELAAVKTVFTTHNLGYQGYFWDLDWHLLNLDRSFFTPRYLEFYGKINFLKGGLVFSDILTTVSPTYAREIMTPEYGFGLDSFFREHSSRLFGILNGVDYNVWNPESDRYLVQNYTLADLSGKQACKTELQRIMQLEVNPSVPLVCMVSRLVSQKGLDLLPPIFNELMARGIQFASLGSGDVRYENYFRQLKTSYPGRVGVRFDFDEKLAHRVIAGADFVLMPSQYEPGGLTHLYGLKYGTIPVVRSTGGLKDTVQNFNPQSGTGIGFTFDKFDVASLLEVMERALAVFRQQDAWRILVRNAMSADFSWQNSAQTYLELYRSLLKS